MMIGTAICVSTKVPCVNVTEFHRITRTKYVMDTEIVSVTTDTEVVDTEDTVLGLEVVDTAAEGMVMAIICLLENVTAIVDGGESSVMKILLRLPVMKSQRGTQQSVLDMENVSMMMFVSATKIGVVLDVESTTDHQIATDIGLDTLGCVMVMDVVYMMIIANVVHNGWVKVARIL
ncbi:MAG: hypothetical protein ACTSUE_16785 [Promethearchaeota archaeon]